MRSANQICRFGARALALVPLALASAIAPASIPDPQNIFYGNVAWQGQPIAAADSDVAVTIESGGTEVAKYRMGTMQQAGDFYVLSLPIYAVDPPQGVALRPGDRAEIHLEKAGVKHYLVSITVGTKGQVSRLDVSEDTDLDGMPDITDSDDDNDGMPDAYELSQGFDPLSAADALLDADGNGSSNLDDYLASLEPKDPPPPTQVSDLLPMLIQLLLD
jgi:hypothetical protein